MLVLARALLRLTMNKLTIEKIKTLNSDTERIIGNIHNVKNSLDIPFEMLDKHDINVALRGLQQVVSDLYHNQNNLNIILGED